jgi:hypothetical protein
MAISYDREQRKFNAYKREFPVELPVNVKIEGDKSYVLLMKEDKEVTFTGEGWDGTMEFLPGLNMAAVPLNPGKMRYSDLAKLFEKEEVSPITLIIHYDDISKKFVAFNPNTMPEIAPTNALVRGGEGIIINAKAAAKATIEGEPWENVPAESASPVTSALMGDVVATPLLVVEGAVIREDGGSIPDGIKVLARNLTTKMEATGGVSLISRDGYYMVMLIDMVGSGVAQAGDVLEVSIRDSTGTFGTERIRHIVTRDEIMSGVVSLEVKLYLIPKKDALLQNFPNPFNPDTWIPYQLRGNANVVIKIYSATGQLVRTLNLGHKPAGFYTEKKKAAYWDGRNEAGEHVASGVYFYQIKAGDFNATRKMVIVK